MTNQTPKIAEPLLRWYDANARQLPWRVAPQDRAAGVLPDPYRIWLSEIMLQQTTVATVKSYFEKFTNRWPNVAALSAASQDDVLRDWAGLGYYSRARNLKKCADIVVRDHDAKFPADLDALRALPGIGDYTAAAIASIAFDIPAPVMDGNVERVFARLFAIDAPLPAAKPLIKQHIAETLSQRRPGDFAQACMDLGATTCTPKNPGCMHCPLKAQCVAFAQFDPQHFPVKAPKKQKPKRVGAAFVVVSSDGDILLEQRPESGLLASMSQVPTTDWNSRRDGATDLAAAPFQAVWENCGNIDHVFTHFELELTVWRTKAPLGFPLNENQWWSAPNKLGGEALPTVMKKAIACAMTNPFKVQK